MQVPHGLLDFDRQLPTTMPLDTAERLYLERQVTLARAIFVALALVDLIEMAGAGSRTAAAIFLAVYLLLALAVLVYERMSSEANSVFRWWLILLLWRCSFFCRLRFPPGGSCFCLWCLRWLRRAIRAQCWRW